MTAPEHKPNFLDLEVIESLANWLRVRGHTVSLGQIADIQYLLLNLQELGVETTAETLPRWIIPILALTSRDSVILKRDIAAWLTSFGSSPNSPVDSLTPASDTRWTRVWLKTWPALLVALILLAAVAWYAMKLVVAPDIDTGAVQKPTRPAVQSKKERSLEQMFIAISQPADRFGLGLLVIVGVGVGWVITAKRSLIVMRRRSNTTLPTRRYFFRGRSGELPFSARTIRRLRVLHAPDMTGGMRIDLVKSIATTIRKVGFVEVQREQATIPPEYLLLIEQQGYADHVAEFGEQIHQRLKDERIFVDKYEFHLNPTRFLQRSPGTLDIRRSVTLDNLMRTHSRQKLIIVSDGQCFLDAVTARPHEWISEFERAALKILITPRPPEIWDEVEQELMAVGFVVVPQGSWGIERLADLIEALTVGNPVSQPHGLIRGAADRGRPVPHFIRERRELLTNPVALLSEEDLRKLLRALRSYLRDRGFYWLVACAVFPILHPRLTLHLGKSVRDEHGTSLYFQEDPERYFTLARLPWFRVGVIPDWLREALIRSMPEWLRVGVLQELNSLMSNLSRQGAPGTIALDFTSRPDKTWSAADYEKALRRPENDRTCTGLPRDYLFLGFMSGRAPATLSLSAPPALRFRELRAAFLRLAALTAAAVVALAVLIGSWPESGFIPNQAYPWRATSNVSYIALLSILAAAPILWTLDRAVTELPRRLRWVATKGQYCSLLIMPFVLFYWAPGVHRTGNDRNPDLLISLYGVTLTTVLSFFLMSSQRRRATAAIRFARSFAQSETLTLFLVSFSNVQGIVELFIQRLYLVQPAPLDSFSDFLLGQFGGLLLSLLVATILVRRRPGRRVMGFGRFVAIYGAMSILSECCTIPICALMLEFGLGPEWIFRIVVGLLCDPTVYLAVIILVDFLPSLGETLKTLAPWLIALSITKWLLLTSAVGLGSQKDLLMPYNLLPLSNFFLLELTLPAILIRRRRAGVVGRSLRSYTINITIINVVAAVCGYIGYFIFDYIQKHPVPSSAYPYPNWLNPVVVGIFVGMLVASFWLLEPARQLARRGFEFDAPDVDVSSPEYLLHTESVSRAKSFVPGKP